MGILQEFLQRVEGKISAVRAIRHSTAGDRYETTHALQRLRDPNLVDKTHCSTCGLPKDKHISHEPPDVQKPEDGKNFGPYFRALDQHYRTGLQALTDAELTAMPLPISERRLLGIAAEVKERLDKQPPSRWAKIGGDDEDWL